MRRVAVLDELVAQAQLQQWWVQAVGLNLPLLQLGLRDEFIEHGDPAQLLAMQGLDAEGIVQSVRARFSA